MLHQESDIHSFLIKALAITDLLFGMYLAVIILSDIIHGDQYALHEFEWRGRVLCHTDGILSSVSFLMSAFTVTWLAVVRCVIITKHGEKPKWMETKTVMSISFILITLFILIFLGIVFITRTANNHLYQPNAICLMLLSNSKHSHLAASLVLTITLTLVPLFVIICISYIKIFLHTRQVALDVKKTGSTTKQSNKTRSVSLNMMVIILLYALCWFPLLITFILAYTQIDIDSSIMAIIVVGIMPINSIINPLLYTLKSQNFWSPLLKCLHIKEVSK